MGRTWQILGTASILGFLAFLLLKDWKGVAVVAGAFLLIWLLAAGMDLMGYDPRNHETEVEGLRERRQKEPPVRRPG